MDVGELDPLEHERSLQRLFGRLLRVEAGRTNYGWIFTEGHPDDVQVFSGGA